MSASANPRTRTAERLPRWSSTGHAGARPAQLSAPHSAPIPILIGAQSNPISHTSSQNQRAQTPRRFAATSSQRSNPHR
jgi:hypothetical protein